MKNIWKNLDEIATLIKSKKTKLLMLDFDGTLTPIVKIPKMAKLSPKSRLLLKNLCRKKRFYLAIISGRELKDLKEKIGLPNIIYGGIHGLEGEILNRQFSFPITNKTFTALKEIREKLDRMAKNFSGVFIENKRQVLSFHYRRANKQQIPTIKILTKETLAPYIKDKLISVIEGKMVFDIFPKVNWNKGSFANLVIKEMGRQTKTAPITIFIGDDVTDEDVFQVLKKDITIKVGGSYRSSAKYHLRNSGEVIKFLKWIESLV